MTASAFSKLVKCIIEHYVPEVSQDSINIICMFVYVIIFINIVLGILLMVGFIFYVFTDRD